MIDADSRMRQLMVHDESDYEGKKTMVKVSIALDFISVQFQADIMLSVCNFNFLRISILNFVCISQCLLTEDIVTHYLVLLVAFFFFLKA